MRIVKVGIVVERLRTTQHFSNDKISISLEADVTQGDDVDFVITKLRDRAMKHIKKHFESVKDEIENEKKKKMEWLKKVIG